jgi:hypothetical protein
VIASNGGLKTEARGQTRAGRRFPWIRPIGKSADE